MAAMNHRGGDLSMPEDAGSGRSADFAWTFDAERDDSPPFRRQTGLFWHFPAFRQLLRNALRQLAAGSFPPHLVGMDAGRSPENGQIVEQVGALANHGVRPAVDGVDDNLDRFFR